MTDIPDMRRWFEHQARLERERRVRLATGGALVALTCILVASLVAWLLTVIEVAVRVWG